MDSRTESLAPEALADEVRAKRLAIDNDLELLRVRLQKADPRRIDTMRWAKTAGPVLAALGAAFLFTRRKRSVNSLLQLLVKELSDLYASEKLLVPALGRMSAKAGNAELKQAFDMHRVETPEGSVEFNLPVGAWIRLFREHGFVVEDLIELRPREGARSTYRTGEETAWARRWPMEQIWKARKA